MFLYEPHLPGLVFHNCFLAQWHGLKISLRKLLSVVIDFGQVGGQRFCASVVMP